MSKVECALDSKRYHTRAPYVPFTHNGPRLISVVV